MKCLGKSKLNEDGEVVVDAARTHAALQLRFAETIAAALAVLADIRRGVHRWPRRECQGSVVKID